MRSPIVLTVWPSHSHRKLRERRAATARIIARSPDPPPRGPPWGIVVGVRGVIAVLLAAFAGVLSPAAARAAIPPWPPASPYGMHSMLYLDAPPAFQETLFREAAAMRAAWIRLDVAVTDIVRTPRARDWRALDSISRSPAATGCG